MSRESSLIGGLQANCRLSPKKGTLFLRMKLKTGGTEISKLHCENRIWTHSSKRWSWRGFGCHSSMNPERSLLWSYYSTETPSTWGIESKSRERNQRLEEGGQMASLYSRKMSRGRLALRRPGQMEFKWMQPGPSVAHPQEHWASASGSFEVQFGSILWPEMGRYQECFSSLLLHHLSKLISLWSLYVYRVHSEVL